MKCDVTEPCVDDPCGGGSCVPTSTSYICNCEPGCSFANKYMFVQTQKTLADAKTICSEYGLQLVRIETSEEFDEIIRYVSHFNMTKAIWTSGRLTTPGTWSEELSDWSWNDGTGTGNVSSILIALPLKAEGTELATSDH